MPRRSGLSVDDAPSLPGYRDFVPIARSEGSEVYRAFQTGVDRPVAVKVLLLDDPEAVARFQRELDITVQLGRQHPHIVTVIDTGTTAAGRPCIVMEHYDRGSLHDRLRAGGPVPWGEVLAAGTVVADALSFAHRHGVLHRDVKPQNILVLPTSYVVADFGIARRIDAARTTSVEWFSFRHAAPQVLDGDPPAVADDIWSLGSTMFTLLDGQPPFAVGDAAEDTALAYMKRVRTGRRRALARPDVPAGLVAIIDRCLQHERADRFPDAAALRDALASLAAETRAWAPPGATGSPPTGSPGAGPIATGPTGAGPIAAGPTGGGPKSAGPLGAGSPLTRSQATGSPVHPAGFTDRTGGMTSQRAGQIADRPPVVPVQPTAMVPQTAPPLPATAMPPPTQGRTGTPPQVAGSTAPPRVAGSAAPPPSQATAGPPAVVEGATIKGQAAAMSPSALAHVVASAVAAGGYAVGEETTGTTTGSRYAEPLPAAPASPAAGRNLRRILVGTAVALLIGGVLGIGGTWVAGMSRGDADVSGQGRPGGTPAGQAASARPSGQPTGQPSAGSTSRVNSRIAPVITAITAVNDTTVRLRWRDQSNGQAQFVVVRVVNDGTQPLLPALAQGSTEFVVEDLNPATAPYCFQILAITGPENAPSGQRCVDPAG
jgi:hypothetical protein